MSTTDSEYDAIYHARELIGTKGTCMGPRECSECFTKQYSEGRMCTKESAYKFAIIYIEKNDNRGTCESLW